MKINFFLLITGTLLLTSCGETEKKTTTKTTMETEKTATSLGSELNDRKANFGKKASSEKKKIYAAGIAAVEANKIASQALQVGETALNFTLPNASGKTITLYEQLEKGPVILMWYRGGWCPYCNITLHYMQEALPDFQKYGANLVAISPEVPDSSITTMEKHELQFEVLSDTNNRVAHQYKIVFKLTEEVAKIYEDNFGLSDYNGNTDAELPLAATYIIGQDKIIKYAFLDPDYRNRAEPGDLIAFLKGM